MESFLLNSAACLAILLVFYKLLLENTANHHFKRFFLLASLLISFGIPLITFTTYIEVPVTLPTSASNSSYTTVMPEEAPANYLPYFLWSLYGLGVLFFSLKFIRNLFRMIQKIKQNPIYKDRSIFHVLLKNPTTPHTFFQYVFLNKKEFEHHLIPEEVLLHEQAHARERHSIDILFIELLQILFWFNPFIYFFKYSIKLNHEFLADRAVLGTGAETATYQKILLAFSSHAETAPLANSINYSFIKKRFTIMKTHTSKKTIWFRSLLILPLLAILLYGFSTKETIVKHNSEEPVISEEIQKEATKAQIKEYNTLAKKYNAMPRNNMQIIGTEVERLHYLYDLMSDEQRADAEPFPKFPPPPPAPDAPRAPKPPKASKAGNGNVIPPPPPKPPAPDKADGKGYKQIYTVPMAPPPPNPDPVAYVKELAKAGATFYLGPHKVSADEALKLVKQSDKVTIDTGNYPEVHLGGC